MKTYLRLMLFIFFVYFPARCSPSPRRSPRVEPYGRLSGFVVFTCSFCLFLTPLIYLQLVHEVLACFSPHFFQLGVHRFLTRSPRVESYGWLSVFVVFTCSFCLFLTHLLYLQLVHEAQACFFYKTNSPRCAPIPRRSPRVESYGWLSVFVVFTCSFCLFLTHLLYLQLVHEALACFFHHFFS